MRVFLYEFTAAVGLSGGGKLATLQPEGWAMLQAALQDFGRIPGLEIVTLVDERIQVSLPAGEVVRIRSGEQAKAFRDLARSAAYTLVIAPEFDQILLTRCRLVEAVGGRLLGPSSSAVELIGDKVALGRHLRDHRVPAPDCCLYNPDLSSHPPPCPFVWKPRQGAGSQATFLVRSPGDVARCAEIARAEGWQGEAIVQPFVPGQPASVAFLIGSRRHLAFPPATQELSADGRFHYRGGTVPLPPTLAERAVKLAKQALATVSGLRGYVGVDLVLGAAADGSEDCVIEINPRLTTSYVGLRALARTNLAEAWFRIVTGDELVEPGWSKKVVHFRADGTIS